MGFVLTVAGLVTGLGRAEERAPKPWYEEVTVNGFLSTTYSYNYGRPDSRTNTLRVFDFDDNSFKVDVAELVVQHPAAAARESGFRIDVAMGGSVPRVSAASGLFRDVASGQAEDIDLQQAYASYVAPVGSGLRVDAGKFVTHLGLEVIEGYDGWNDNATRSWLFGYAIPFTHTGLRGSYTFGPKLAAMAMIANGWDNATDNNRAKTAGAQLVITPVAPLTVYVNGVLGAERTDSNSDLRRVIDFVATYKASPRVTVSMNLDGGNENDAVPAIGPQASSTGRWLGAAGYVRLAATERWALIVRGERFWDRDGIRTGVTQTLSELTLTPELHVTPRFLVRADLRADHSNESVFEDHSRPVDHQTTLLLNALVTF